MTAITQLSLVGTHIPPWKHVNSHIHIYKAIPLQLCLDSLNMIICVLDYLPYAYFTGQYFEDDKKQYQNIM